MNSKKIDSIVLNESNTVKIEYFVVEGEYLGHTCYGVNIEKKVDGMTICSEMVPNITVSKDEIGDVIKMLVKHSVTPWTVKDVLTDYIDERQFVAYNS